MRRRFRWRAPELMAVTVAVWFCLLLAACGGGGVSVNNGSSMSDDTSSSPVSGGTVSVLYGGSLVQLMEEGLGPAFESETAYDYQGEGKGVMAAVNLIKDGLRSPDLFITPEADVNRLLMGEENGNLLDWYMTFASTEVVIAYDPSGRYAEDFDRVRAGEVPWYEVIRRPGLRLGRPDPDLAPLGYRVILALELAERELGLEGIRAEVLGEDRNPDQLFPAEELTTRLEAGQLDFIFCYTTNAVPHGLPYILLPVEINQGDPSHTDTYASVSYVDSAKGITYRGAPVVYTIGITTQAANPQGAEAFIRFLFSPEGQELLKTGGASPVEGRYGGDLDAVPPGLRDLIAGPLGTT